jgi:hypothetical protein
MPSAKSNKNQVKIVLVSVLSPPPPDFPRHSTLRPPPPFVLLFSLFLRAFVDPTLGGAEMHLQKNGKKIDHLILLLFYPVVRDVPGVEDSVTEALPFTVPSPLG